MANKTLPAPPIDEKTLRDSPELQRWLQSLAAYLKSLEARVAALETP